MTDDEFKQMNDAIRDAPNPQAWLAAVDALEIAPDRPIFKLPCARCLCRDTDKQVEAFSTEAGEERVTVVCLAPCPDRVGDMVGIMDICNARFERWWELREQRLGR